MNIVVLRDQAYFGNTIVDAIFAATSHARELCIQGDMESGDALHREAMALRRMLDRYPERAVELSQVIWLAS